MAETQDGGVSEPARQWVVRATTMGFRGRWTFDAEADAMDKVRSLQSRGACASLYVMSPELVDVFGPRAKEGGE